MTDRMPTMQGQTSVETTLRFSIWKKKQQLDCSQCNCKKLLKQRLDFPLEQRIETTERSPAVEGHKNCWNNGEIFHLTKELKGRRDCLQCKAKKLLKQRLYFPFEKRIETMDRLPTVQSQKSFETTVRFPIWQKNWNNA